MKKKTKKKKEGLLACGKFFPPLPPVAPVFLSTHFTHTACFIYCPSYACKPFFSLKKNELENIIRLQITCENAQSEIDSLFEVRFKVSDHLFLLLEKKKLLFRF